MTRYLQTSLFIAFLATLVGSHEIVQRIIGGVTIRDRCIAPFSWMVGLQFRSAQGPITFCGAVMLDNITLVTSATCIFRFATTNSLPSVAVVGDRDLLSTDPEEQVLNIAGLRVNPGYNQTTYDNNIGLIRLATPARYGPCVQPAQAMEDDPSACADLDTSCVMAGWGPFAENNQITNSRVLRSAPITVFGDFVTLQLELLRTQSAQPVGSLYAEAQQSFQKACFFDQGGVVSCVRNGQQVLRGVIGEINCNSNPTPPIMVTDVTLYQQWVDACRRNWDSVTCRGQ